jgi:CheY-like chemotaxis protein
LGGPGGSSIVSVESSLDPDGANTATFNVTVETQQVARGLEGRIHQAAASMLLRLEDVLSEASAEAERPTVLVYDVSGPMGRDKLCVALKKIGCKAVFVESWGAAIEALQGGSAAAEYAAFFCDVKPEGGWSRIEDGGERGTSGWDVARMLRDMAGDDTGAGDAEGGGSGGDIKAKSSVLRRCKTGVPVIGIGTTSGDHTASDPRAATVPVSSIICHCEEAGMLTYVQKPLTTPRLRTVLAGIVPGVQRWGCVTRRA